MNLKEIIQNLANENSQIYSLVCTVNDVNLSKLTCDVQPVNGNAEVQGVYLSANLGSKDTFIQIPVKGSYVIVTFINESTAYLSMCADVDKFIVKSKFESLKDILKDLIGAIEIMTVGTAVGPSTPPINVAQFTAIKTRLDLLLKE